MRPLGPAPCAGKRPKRGRPPSTLGDRRKQARITLPADLLLLLNRVAMARRVAATDYAADILRPYLEAEAEILGLNGEMDGR